jgi:hypothetical protein
MYTRPVDSSGAVTTTSGAVTTTSGAVGYGRRRLQQYAYECALSVPAQLALTIKWTCDPLIKTPRQAIVHLAVDGREMPGMAPHTRQSAAS